LKKRQSAKQKFAKKQANVNQNKPKNKQPASLQKSRNPQKKQAQVRWKP